MALTLLAAAGALALCQAQTVPTDIQGPGTQPGEAALESISRCDNCHAGYDAAVEPFHGWAGSAMAHATRDPLFWATVAVAEQDFQGSGDLCLRCHTPEGWMEGRSTPTDGSTLRPANADGVSCDVCHQLTNPDDSEHLGVQNAPFVANDGEPSPHGYYGSAMFVLYGATEKLGPYSDPDSPHQALQSSFHRSSDLCGTCHDVSNPAVGDLAHNHGAMVPLQEGTYSGIPGAPVATKAAFNSFPYQYGVVERTYSEHMASAFPGTRVADYGTLPAELQAGSIQRARDAAVAAVPGGDYADGTQRFFTCQTCHMPPTQGKGCNKQGAPLRSDLPRHDLVGANYWIPDALEYLDGLDALVIGGGLSATQLAAMTDGKQRALDNLAVSAGLEVDQDTLRVVNLTGHKLISGYPEGRRMWVRVRWRNAAGILLREDGGYGPVATVLVDGAPVEVESILDLDGTNTRIYQAKMGLTREWAAQLLGLGYDPALALEYDRVTGAVDFTLGELAALPAGSVHESFHFVLNNVVVEDDRIPPYGMSYDEAERRNCLPVPATQYGDPGPGGTYLHWDELELEPPVGAATATIELLYQPTSWEYVQFLHLANDGSVAFLADTGADLLDAWLALGMAAPEVMATTTWAAQPDDCNQNGVPDDLDLAAGTSLDCNGNGLPDECDIASGTSADANGNGVPDECEPPGHLFLPGRPPRPAPPVTVPAPAPGG